MPRRELTNDDMKFFYNAVAASNAGGKSDAVMILESVERTRDGGTDEEAAVALEDLIDRCEQTENAGNMLSAGGAEALTAMLRAGRGEIRKLAARALATVTQNHPEAQVRAANAGAVEAILDVVRIDNDDGLRGASLWALSCLIRDCVEAAKAFEAAGGVEVCTQFISMPTLNDRIRAKALHLGRHAFVQSEENMSDAVEHGAIKSASECVRSEDVNVREAAATLLLLIAQCVDFTKNPKAVDQFRSAKAHVAKALSNMQFTTGPDAESNEPTRQALEQLIAMLTE